VERDSGLEMVSVVLDFIARRRPRGRAPPTAHGPTCQPLPAKSSSPAYPPALAPTALLHASTLASPPPVSAHVDACAQRRQKVVEREERCFVDEHTWAHAHGGAC
jgi:hypothetical protein